MTTGSAAAYDYTTYEYHDERGDSVVEKWLVEGMGHAWSGRAEDGEYTAPGGPDASRIVREFVSGFTQSE